MQHVMTEKPKLSVVLPCYNEAKGLEALVKRFEETGRGVPFELILVDNGSTDDTQQVLKNLLTRFPFARTVHVEVNQGYGHGILTGLKATLAEVVAWSHADLQTDPADVFRAWHVYQKANGPQRTLVKGCRSGRALKEQIISWGMQTVATVLLQTRFEEINAQPKLFHRDLLACLTNPPPDLSFDLYVLYAARQCGWRTLAIPVEFPPRQHGESSWATSWKSKARTIGRSIRYMMQLSAEAPPILRAGPTAPITATAKSADRAAA